MFNRLIPNCFPLLFAFMLLIAGCVNKVTVYITPETNFSGIKSIHVVKSAPDKRGIDKMIASRLEIMGYHATTGDDTPSDADAIITYEDKWMWDITMYMIQLTVIVRDKDSGFPLATANSMHGSLTRKAPDEMVAEVLRNLFAALK